MITASLVKQLREETGAGMMECKKALEEAQGNLEAAVTIMRKSGQANAMKKGGRVAAEGVVAVKISHDCKTAFMVEVNCETDFASRDESFLEFVTILVNHGLTTKITMLDEFLSLVLIGGQTVLSVRESLVAKIGENINVRRIKLMSIDGAGAISSYVHGNGRIGVMVGLSVVNPELGKDIAMHIAACRPEAILATELPESLLAKEKEIYLAEVQNSGKPKEVQEKILSGRLQKFINEITLVKQSFVKDPDVTIEALLQKSKAEVLSFVRFEVGAGIEKRATDFASEVQAQVESIK